MSRMDHLDVNGAKLAFTIDGASHLPWLIVSNSLATDHRLWNRQLPAFTQVRRVVRYDTRGHGRSSAAAGPYDFNMLCGDVVAIMDHLDIDSTDVLGLSLGGMTVLGLCLDHADRVNRAICCCARADFPPQMAAVWDDRMNAVKKGGMLAVAEGTLVRWFTGDAKRKQPEIIDLARDMILATSVNGYCGCIEAIKGVNYHRRLSQLAKPILYVAGEFDVAAAPEAMRDMAYATPNAKFETIANAAHLANLENATNFNQVISDFLIAAP